MRKKVLGLSLAILFFGSITSSTFAMTVSEDVKIAVVDDEKNKKKAKKSKAKSSECAKECSSKSKESCDGKNKSDKK